MGNLALVILTQKSIEWGLGDPNNLTRGKNDTSGGFGVGEIEGGG